MFLALAKGQEDLKALILKDKKKKTKKQAGVLNLGTRFRGLAKCRTPNLPYLYFSRLKTKDIFIRNSSTISDGPFLNLSLLGYVLKFRKAGLSKSKRLVYPYTYS